MAGFIAGCTAGTSTSISSEAAPALAPTDVQFDSFYHVVIKNRDDAHASRGLALDANAIGPTARSLIDQPLVQAYADAVYESRLTGRPQTRNVTADDTRSFLRSLTSGREQMLAELAADVRVAGKDNGTSRRFDHVLLSYLKAYAAGTFVDRQGNNLSIPSLSGGISDEDIQGLVTVFFEALYDCWFEMPVFYKVGNAVEVFYDPPPRPDADVGEGDSGLSQLYRRTYSPIFFTAENVSPTAVEAGVVQPVRIDQQAAPSLNERHARALQRIAKLAGRQAKSLSGMLFGSLSNVNVSFVLGADFAVGDNETLLHLVRTASEVSARRSAEYFADSAIADRASGVLAIDGAPQAARLEMLVEAMTD